MRTIIYTAEPYTGRKIGNSYMERVGYQVVATDPRTGKRFYAFGSSPCYKVGWVASHYSSGVSAADRIKLQGYKNEAERIAEFYTRDGIINRNKRKED